MNTISEHSLLSRSQKIFLVLAGVLLAAILFFVRGAITSNSPLSQLAGRSIDPEIALANGKPTLIEFYADWCEACKEMAPTVLEMEKRFSDNVDFVLLNVDNPRWEYLIDKYDVKGIPQIQFFDNLGSSKGSAIGLRSTNELNDSIELLIKQENLPQFMQSNISSRLKSD